MKTDSELLELAAKAAGIWDESDPWKGLLKGTGQYWNPQDDDCDALRLAVGLRLSIDHNHPEDDDRYVMVSDDTGKTLAMVEIKDESQRPAATRRAIVRAAAEIQTQKERTWKSLRY